MCKMYWVMVPTWHNKSVTGSCEGFPFSPEHGKSKDDRRYLSSAWKAHGWQPKIPQNWEFIEEAGLIVPSPPFLKLHEQTSDKQITLTHSWEAVDKFKGIRIIVLIYLLMEHVSLQNTAFENTALLIPCKMCACTQRAGTEYHKRNPGPLFYV